MIKKWQRFKDVTGKVGGEDKNRCKKASIKNINTTFKVITLLNALKNADKSY